ncbi:uncharacterized protein [Pagrus major]|uniref:uncharacterized protein n=1 Tax=Pagrus major TaxID=143350 RepID=UPI003CC8759F
MEDFHISSTSQDKSFNYSNITSNYNYSSNINNSNELHGKVKLILFGVTYVITAIGLPLTLVAIYAVYSLVRKDHVVPLYVINLLISDLIQLCCLITLAAGINKLMFGNVLQIYWSSLMASVCFMLCIALERYLVIACPLWYRFRRTIKFSVVLCVVVWVLSPVTVLIFRKLRGVYSSVIIGALLFFPLPLFIFFLVGTLKALSASRVPSDEKRRIVGILVLVLLIYTLLFLPAIIWFMAESYGLLYLYTVFLQLSPLADLFLYVFMRKGIIDKLLDFVCCCRMDSNDSGRMDSNDITSSTV